MRPVVYPSDWLFRNEPPPLSDFGRRLLAEGDSWFTLGTLNLPAASNLLFKLEFDRTTAIVNCAYPGATLQHVADNIKDPYFNKLLWKPNFASYWEAIVLSAGGNDLIDAARHRATNADGSPALFGARVLLTPAEASTANPDVTGAERFISEPGWTALATYLLLNFGDLVARRDRGPSAKRPMVVHTYHVPVVRPAGMIGSPNGWLYPALGSFGIPSEEWQGVAAALFERLRQLLLSLDANSGQPQSLPNFHVFDSAQLAQLVPATSDATGVSGDWVNEIHPTPAGYAKIGRLMGPWIDAVLAQYP